MKPKYDIDFGTPLPEVTQKIEQIVTELKELLATNCIDFFYLDLYELYLETCVIALAELKNNHVMRAMLVFYENVTELQRLEEKADELFNTSEEIKKIENRS